MPIPFPGSTSQLFTRCGQFLCGSDSKWKQQFAAMLMVKANTVDNMSKGTSRVPPAMWREIAAFIQDRENQAPGLRMAALQAAEAYAEIHIGPAAIGRAIDHDAVDHVNHRLRALEPNHEFGGAAAWLQRDGGLVVKVPRSLSVEAVEGLKLRVSKEIADLDARDTYESLIAAHVTRHSVCFTHELEAGAVSAGSGVLVRCGRSFGILTCAHVLWDIVRNMDRQPARRVGISVPAAAGSRVQAVSMQLMEFVQLPMIMKRVDNGDDGWSENGPDIGFVQLPPSTGAVLAALGSVLDLDAQAALSGASWSASATEVMHLLTGVSESHVGRPVQMHGHPVVPIETIVVPVELEAVEPLDGFDRLRMEPVGRNSYPASYRGMSGGGVWAVTFGQRDGSKAMLDCRLTGIAYYETNRDDVGGRRIIGHGSSSIYDRLLPEIRTLNSGV